MNVYDFLIVGGAFAVMHLIAAFLTAAHLQESARNIGFWWLFCSFVFFECVSLYAAGLTVV